MKSTVYDFLTNVDECVDVCLKLAFLFSVLQEIWAGILANPDVLEDTDFFKAGAGSMDVTR